MANPAKCDFFTLITSRSVRRNSSVSIVHACLEDGGPIPDGGNHFPFSIKPRTDFGPSDPPSYETSTRLSYPTDNKAAGMVG
jgi:hypothetical protein